MKTVTIAGFGDLELENLVLDLNGTLTESGDFVSGVLDDLDTLQAEGFTIYILSGDTRGSLKQAFELPEGIDTVVAETAEDKKRFVESIGAKRTVCVGNGNIDVEMFKVAGLSMCTIQAEGATTRAMLSADIVVIHIKHAFEILLDPNKLIATLRA